MADIWKGLGDVAGGIGDVVGGTVGLLPGVQRMRREEEQHQENLKQAEFNRAQERIRNLKALAEERGGRQTVEGQRLYDAIGQFITQSNFGANEQIQLAYEAVKGKWPKTPKEKSEQLDLKEQKFALKKQQELWPYEKERTWRENQAGRIDLQQKKEANEFFPQKMQEEHLARQRAGEKQRLELEVLPEKLKLEVEQMRADIEAREKQGSWYEGRGKYYEGQATSPSLSDEHIKVFNALLSTENPLNKEQQEYVDGVMEILQTEVQRRRPSPKATEKKQADDEKKPTLSERAVNAGKSLLNNKQLVRPMGPQSQGRGQNTETDWGQNLDIATPTTAPSEQRQPATAKGKSVVSNAEDIIRKYKLRNPGSRISESHVVLYPESIKYLVEAKAGGNTKLVNMILEKIAAGVSDSALARALAKHQSTYSSLQAVAF